MAGLRRMEEGACSCTISEEVVGRDVSSSFFFRAMVAWCWVDNRKLQPWCLGRSDGGTDGGFQTPHDFVRLADLPRPARHHKPTNPHPTHQPTTTAHHHLTRLVTLVALPPPQRTNPCEPRSRKQPTTTISLACPLAALLPRYTDHYYRTIY